MIPWLQLVPAALSAASSLFGKKPPKYQAPPPPNLGDLSMQLNQAAPMYDIGKGDVYRGLMSERQGLPAGYRDAMLNQSRKEAQTNFEQIAASLSGERDRATRSAAEQLNKLGLLSSGALGVRQGMIDQSYGNQLGNLAANLQNQLSGVSTNLMEQEFAQKNRIQQLLASLEQNRASNSLTARQGLGTLFGQAGTFALGNAQNQYSADLNAYEAQRRQMDDLTNAFSNASSIYGIYNPSKRAPRR